MAYQIPGDCISCDSCRPQCPTGAISTAQDDGRPWINPALCNNCDGYFPEPQCLKSCPIDLPIPYKAKKGRAKTQDQVTASTYLFTNGKNTSFASAIIVWEACNLLAQRQSLSWQVNETGMPFYERSLRQNKGQITLHINPALLPTKVTSQLDQTLEALDIRSACMHLIYAAHATTLDQPWEQEFVISSAQIEEYLGLDKRRDLTKLAKLSLIQEIACQPCSITACIDFPSQGKIQHFSIPASPLWHLREIQHHFQEDELGCKHLVSLSFRIQPGLWTQHFLNRQACKQRSAFYQYGTLPKSLLTTIMGIWQQHDGAARIMLWLLFKVRIGNDQPITVPTLMRIAYGESRIQQAQLHREERKRILKTFENDLAVLSDYGLHPIFDPTTYPPDIQPLWAKLADLPDDPEAALEFWTQDGSRNQRLTDAGPRGKWLRLLNARILSFQLPDDWSVPQLNVKVPHRQRTQAPPQVRSSENQPTHLSCEQIMTARQHKGLSQRQLALHMGKSQSWIRDVEHGRFQAKSTDQEKLRKILELTHGAGGGL